MPNRENWLENWGNFMKQPLDVFKPNQNQLIPFHKFEALEKLFNVADLKTLEKSAFQKGGTTIAQKYIKSFFNNHHKNYMLNISKPLLSHRACSRISSYLAWGNISIRQVWQQAKEIRLHSLRKRQIDAFISRLQRQAHFIQKYEIERTMEKASLTKGHQKLKKEVSLAYQLAWKNGQTGYPLIDACMRYLKETGYLNFKIRALVVSFFTNNLWQPWQEANAHLSQMFLDFEPGIHFTQLQLQLQASEASTNSLESYHPLKSSLKYDTDAEFIKKWVPEVSKLDIPFAHEPDSMTAKEQRLQNFIIDKDYPAPIVNIIEHIKKK